MKLRHRLLLWVTGTRPLINISRFAWCVDDVASYRKDILHGITDLRLYQGDAEAQEYLSEGVGKLISDIQDTTELYHTVLPPELLFDMLWDYHSLGHRIDGNPHQFIRDHVEHRWYVGAREIYSDTHRGYKNLPEGAKDIPLSEIFQYVKLMLERICVDVYNHEFVNMKKYL